MLFPRKFVFFVLFFLAMVACAPLVDTFEVGVESTPGRWDERPSVVVLYNWRQVPLPAKIFGE
jgi:hypothetical protein